MPSASKNAQGVAECDAGSMVTVLIQLWRPAGLPLRDLQFVRATATALRYLCGCKSRPFRVDGPPFVGAIPLEQNGEWTSNAPAI
jgi:hypothetical protein